MGRDYTCSVPGGHGPVDFIGALANSCSIYFYRLAPSAGGPAIESMARRMGLGAPIPVPGGGKTVPGNVKPPDDPRLFLDYSVGDAPGISITPWHAVNLMSIIVTGKPVTKGLPGPRLKDSTRRLIRRGMESACRDRYLPGSK